MPEPLRLFNTRTRQVEDFRPLEAGLVRMYCCGPTVYNYAHIGNLRAYVFEDLLRRMLERAGYAVTHVMNVTDVGHLQSDADAGDDKMVLAARREKRSPWEIARYYEEVFLRHTEQLNVRRPTIICRATEHIPQMIQMIECLLRQGHAYVSGGNVYFDVTTFPAYTEFGQLQLDAQQATERVDVDERKRNPADFALWFSESKYPDQVMKWDSPWGVGFPGWHIECSAMASMYLGERIDIHCGGIDHIPVHHTNEIAQSEGCFGHRWVEYWLHGAFLVLESAKMSKSSGDFLHLDRLVADGFEPLDYRYLLLTAHYRAELKFSAEALAGAAEARRSLRNLVQDWRYAASRAGAPAAREDALSRQRAAFWAALADDLHVPKALAVAWTVAREATLHEAEKLALLLDFDQVFGLGLDDGGARGLTEAQAALIREREEARRRRDWATSDAIRDRLLAEGIMIKDRADGTDWSRVE
jgi:cysteinyl-tRNA synthetase